MKTGYWLPDYKKFLHKLINARKDAGFTQEMAARTLNKPQSFISKSEKGERRVDALELYRFATLYNKNLYYFFQNDQMALSKIIQKARDVLDTHNQNRLPVDLDLIAHENGIKITYEKMSENASALLIFDGSEQAKIVVNQDHHEHRQRFSIAHEMGHFFLDHKLNHHVYEQSFFFRKKGDHDGDDKENNLELEANNFASELLMPSPVLEKCLQQYKKISEEEALTQKLAKKFKVSTIAMQLRLQRYSNQVF